MCCWDKWYTFRISNQHLILKSKHRYEVKIRLGRHVIIGVTSYINLLPDWSIWKNAKSRRRLRPDDLAHAKRKPAQAYARGRGRHALLRPQIWRGRRNMGNDGL